MKKWFWWAVLAYIVSLLLRFYYPFLLGDLYYYKGWLLNTNDGYFYAQGARDLLLGVKSTLHSPINEMLSQITAFLAWILPLSLEQIIFYMSGFFGCVIVFLIVYLARHFGGIISFLCGVLSGIGVSYYNRTMFGYYDTDMLVVVFGLLVGVVIFDMLEKTSKIQGICLLVCSGVALVYYPSLRYVLIGYSGVLVLFGFFGSRARVVNGILLCVLLGVSLFPQSLILWIIVCVALVLLFNDSLFKFFGRIYYALLVAFGVVLAIKILPEIFGSVYVVGNVSNVDFHYLDVMKSIAEVSSLGFLEFVYRISGNLAWFILGSFGILLLFIKDKRFLIFLPFLVIGFFGYFKGLRFTFYAVPIYALGVGYLLFVILEIFKPKKALAYGLIGVYCVASLFPHLVHIKSYLPLPILEKQEVESLSEIPAKSGDYALAWWDYGYWIGYFAKLNVFIDGGKHSGRDNFPISFILSSTNQKQSYNIAKLLLNNLSFEEFAKARNLSFQEALEALKGDLDLEPKNQDLYFILPYRMLSIFSAIVRFSNRDLESGEAFLDKVLMLSQKKIGNRIFFDSRVYVDKNKGKIGILGEEFAMDIAEILVLKDSARGVTFNSQSPVVLLDLGNEAYVLCDRAYLDSFYFRGMFFDNLDENLFQKVAKNEKIAIYKLKQ